MGRILNALKTADSDIADLVMQCLDEREHDSRRASIRRVAAVVEPIFEKLPVDSLTDLGEWLEKPETAPAGETVRSLSMRISDSAPLLSSRREDRRAAEQYRVIRTKIFHQLSGSSITVISSPGVGDGKTVSAVNLAAALALKSEDKVILVDADLRLSKVHERLGIPKSPGLAEVLSGACTLEEAMLRVEQWPNFYILPAGEAQTNPTELIDSANWRALMARFRAEFRRTLVDSPPVEAVADYDLIAGSCDGVVLVVRPDHTSRPLLNSALAKVKGKLTGVLINDSLDWFLWKRPSSNYHYYQSGPPKEGRKGGK
jgi:protein-tyrosine kinase